VLWHVRTNGIYEAPVIWRDIAIVAESPGKIAAFGLRSGVPVGSIVLPSEFYGHGLALDGDRLFVAGRGKLWAYRLGQ
jgi:hypothetical protein